MSCRATSSQYDEMRKLYIDLDVHLPNELAIKYVRQISRHIYREKAKRLKQTIPTGYPNIKFYGNHDAGCWKDWLNEITLSNKPTLYIICHEVAHKAHDENVWKFNGVEIGTDHHGVEYQMNLRLIAEYARKRILPKVNKMNEETK